MIRDLCADVKMEENYMRMSIEYNCDESKQKIHNAIETIEKEYQIFPTVIRRSISPTAGNFSIEFDSEWVDRDAGEFCEDLLKLLGINHCGI